MPEPETRWLRVRELFDLALAQPTAERDAFVDQAAGHDADLAREVRSLLAALDKAKSVLDRPVAELDGAARDVHAMLGRQIGVYKVTRLIGYGGMGAVYEAERVDGDFAMRVAIKFLRPGVESDLAIRRFRYERRILASLSHRNIAGLFDGGVTAEGDPYFIMEYVDGMPITHYCAHHTLGLRERVALFRQVCTAVQHAHEQFIVHRDLKPGNILVTADGTVKLLDFGIAKLLREEEGPDQLPMTQGGVRAFTPEYASPEQVRGLPIVAASDTYSLGVILCELLTGARPYSLNGKLFAEIEQIICNQPITRPSTLVTDAFARVIGERDARRARAHLTGDIEAILTTALAKEPERRYRTAEQLSEDLTRWMDGRPVTARRASVAYIVRRFIARHRMEVGIAAVAAVSLIGGIVSTSLQARRANLEREKMEQINGFLANMLSAADIDARGPDVTVAEMLGVASRDIQTASLEPEVEAQVRHTLAQTYTGLGMLDSAAIHATRAFELRRQVFGPADTLTGMSLSYVIRVAEMRGELTTAESLATGLVAQYKRQRKPNPAQLAIALNNLARILSTQGRLDESLTLEKEAIVWARQVTDSAGFANLPYSLTNLAISLLYHGEYAQAESLQREALAVEGSHHNRETNAYGELLQGLGVILEEQGRIPEADSALMLALPVLKARGGETHIAYLRALGIQARLRLTGGHYADALAMGKEIMSHVGTSLPEADVNVSMVLQTIAAAQDSLGAPADAESSLVQSLELRRKYLPDGHWATGASEALLGRHYLHVGRYEDAERLMTKGYQQIVAGRGDDASISKLTAKHIALLYARTNRARQAAVWRAKAGEELGTK